MATDTTHSLPPMGRLLPKVLSSFFRSSQMGTQDFSYEQTFRVQRMDETQLQHYQAYFDFEPSGQPPLSYWYLLAQRAQVALMVQKRFPLPLPGMVHFGNTLLQSTVYQADLPLDIVVSVFIEAKAEGSLFPVVKVDFQQAGTTFVSCQSDYFLRRKRKTPKRKQAKEPVFLVAKHEEQWSVPAEAGWSYARLSGDYNPIHLFNWFARMSGFSRRIIHGWYSVSRAAATIERASQASLRYLAVNFKKPLFLPGQATLHWLQEDEATVFQLTDPEQSMLLLEGRVW